MSDSNALRQKRKRAHAAGDHSLCIPSRCGGQFATLKALPEVHDQVRFNGPDADGDAPMYGPMTEKVLDVVAGMLLDDDDPRMVIGLALVEMARAWDETRSASLAKEIAHEMRWLIDHQEGEANALAEIRARMVRKQGGLLIDFANGQTTNVG